MPQNFTFLLSVCYLDTSLLGATSHSSGCVFGSSSHDSVTWGEQLWLKMTFFRDLFCLLCIKLWGLTSPHRHCVLKEVRRSPGKTQTQNNPEAKKLQMNPPDQWKRKLLTELKWSMAAQVLLNLNHYSSKQKLVT